jgi:NADH dehydrogenase FAD-containing subunit
MSRRSPTLTAVQFGDLAAQIQLRRPHLRLRERLDSLGRRGEGGRVLVVGDGLTGIETATEIAESRPGLSVALVARGELGARLSAGARSHLRRACDRLGITVLEHTEVEVVEATRVLCADSTVLASDATVWTAGFTVGTIAAAGGLQVTEDGRIVVDRTMRSVSHPNVYAVGDSAHAIGDNGRPLPMSCASAGYSSMQATAAIVGRLTGRKVPNTKLEYLGNHISLGRRDGILQMVDAEGQAKPKYVGGRKAARIKAGILKMSLWANSHPTFGLPKRKRRLAGAALMPAAPDVSAEKAVA